MWAIHESLTPCQVFVLISIPHVCSLCQTIFSVLTEPPEAFTVAERIRTLVSEHLFAGNEALRVTCSLGVATYPQTATERERLLICADQAMYEAKHLGRNHTCLAEPTKDTHAVSDAGEG